MNNVYTFISLYVMNNVYLSVPLTVFFLPTYDGFCAGFSAKFFKANGPIYSAGAQHGAVNWPICQVFN